MDVSFWIKVVYFLGIRDNEKGMEELEKRINLLKVVFELYYNAGKVIIDYAKNGMY